jgi:transcriptional regulator with XRE-family HTH domain
VSGAVLRAIRDDLGLTQPDMAEALGVSEIVVRSWESGRRPVFNMKVVDLHRHRRTLTNMGADHRKLALIDQAIEVDLILNRISSDDLLPQQHPLATMVPNRTLTELMAWPLTGRPPRQLGNDRPRPPLLAHGERESLAARLRQATERAGNTEAGAMLRRETVCLLARQGGSHEWLREMASRDRCHLPNVQQWTTGWAIHRSHAVAESIQGNSELLRRFVNEGLASDQNITANLNYWAYWAGEFADTRWTSHDQMVTADLHTWTGKRLLESLIGGLASAPYRDLCAHSLWALLSAKPHLIHRAQQRVSLLNAITELLSTPGDLGKAARDYLGQVVYLTRSV